MQLTAHSSHETVFPQPSARTLDLDTLICSRRPPRTAPPAAGVTASRAHRQGFALITRRTAPESQSGSQIMKLSAPGADHEHSRWVRVDNGVRLLSFTLPARLALTPTASSSVGHYPDPLTPMLSHLPPLDEQVLPGVTQREVLDLLDDQRASGVARVSRRTGTRQAVGPADGFRPSTLPTAERWLVLDGPSRPRRR